MSDLIERHKALHCAEMDSEIYIAINCLPTVEAIPVEFIKSEIKENKGFYNSNLRRLLDVWAERKEE